MDKAIKKIVLDLGGKEITLTPKQAQNLKNALDDLFGKKVIKEVIREYIPNPYPVVIREPYYPWRYNPEPRFGDVWCSGGTNVEYSCDAGTLKLTA